MPVAAWPGRLSETNKKFSAPGERDVSLVQCIHFAVAQTFSCAAGLQHTRSEVQQKLTKVEQFLGFGFSALHGWASHRKK